MFDPQTYVETPTKPADPFTLDALIAWLRTKDPEEKYCWSSPGHCLFGQYAKFVGTRYLLLLNRMGARNSNGDTIEPGDIGVGTPHTFGAALERAIAEKGVD